MPYRAGRRADDAAPGVGAERGARPLACRRSLGRWPRRYLPRASGRRAPARCALRPARSDSSPSAPTPPRAAAARPPATLPLPLNSCAKYAALHLLGGSRAAPGSPARETRRPRAPPAPRNPALPPPTPQPHLSFPGLGSGTYIGERQGASQDTGDSTAIGTLIYG